MKSISMAGVLMGMAALASACAPVASSVPKFVRNTVRSDELVAVDSGKFDLRVISKVEVISADQYEVFEKKLDSDYELRKFDEKDAKLVELLEGGTMTNIELAPSINRAEILVVFVLKPAAKTASVKEKSADLELEWLRGEKNEFTFSIATDGSAKTAWAPVKKNLSRVVIAFREAKRRK